jgi:predicted transglutaminase-like protease
MEANLVKQMLQNLKTSQGKKSEELKNTSGKWENTQVELLEKTKNSSSNPQDTRRIILGKVEENVGR